jgi:hypothetical protein
MLGMGCLAVPCVRKKSLGISRRNPPLDPPHHSSKKKNLSLILDSDHQDRCSCKGCEGREESRPISAHARFVTDQKKKKDGKHERRIECEAKLSNTDHVAQKTRQENGRML